MRGQNLANEHVHFSPGKTTVARGPLFYRTRLRTAGGRGRQGSARRHTMGPTDGPTGLLLRFDVSCRTLGFDAPPVAVQLRFLGVGSQWSLVALFPAGADRMVIPWLAAHGVHPVAAPGLAPRTVRCDLGDLPQRWATWVTAAKVLQVDLAATGLATLYVRGLPMEVARLVATLDHDRVAPGEGVQMERSVSDAALTPRQAEVLRNALAMGYFEVPHRVDLRRLGKSMHLSVSAVSQLLRRAQAQVVRSYVDKDALGRGSAMDPDDLPPPSGPKGA